MKNHSKKIILVAMVTCGVTFFSSSCNKDALLNKTPITALDNTKALVTETEYVALTNAAYTPIHWQVGPYTVFPVMFQDIRADNCVSQWASYWVPGAVYDSFPIPPNDPSNLGNWQRWYTVIARANTAINFVSSFKGFTTSGLQQRLIAEAKFLRAFAYFELVRNWGGVPLITKYIGSTTDQIIYPRSSPAQIYAQIQSDATDAAAALPQSYSGQDLGRATQGAAYTLLAKVSLYLKNYSVAVGYCQKVMSSGYSLEPNFADNWNLSNEYGKESIFEIGYSSGYSTDGYNNKGSWSYEFFGFLGAPNCFGNLVPRQGLIDMYDNADTRKDATFILPTTYLPDLAENASVETDIYQYFWTVPAALQSKASARKFYIPVQVARTLPTVISSPLNEKIYRYADVLLMLAEASVNGGGGDGQGALDQIRTRAGLPTIPLTLQNVKDERRRELATEGWDRFSDLVRWGDAAAALAFKNFTAGRDELLPIPQSEIDLVGSSNLPQNPGY
jgi:hypothetical protein